MANKGPFLSGDDRVSFKFHTVKLTIQEAELAAELLTDYGSRTGDETTYQLGASLYNAVTHYKKHKH